MLIFILGENNRIQTLLMTKPSVKFSGSADCFNSQFNIWFE